MIAGALIGACHAGAEGEIVRERLRPCHEAQGPRPQQFIQVRQLHLFGLQFGLQEQILPGALPVGMTDHRLAFMQSLQLVMVGLKKSPTRSQRIDIDRVEAALPLRHVGGADEQIAVDAIILFEHLHPAARRSLRVDLQGIVP